MLPDNKRRNTNHHTPIKKRVVKKTVKPTPRFMAMSKVLGVFIMLAIIIVVGYAMYEMHYQANLDSLAQLIISIFGIGSVYIGFYLTMAKWEHVEYEKTKREKELLKLKKQLQLYNEKDQVEEDLIDISDEINELDMKANELINQEIGE